jgi:DNA-binding NtrC family response regulator
MRERLFREDLFYRLSSVSIALPPLRERGDDIPELVKYSLHRAAAEIGVPAPSIQPEAISFLQAQSWRGNVRELENVVRHALLLARAYPVSLDHAQQAYARVQRPLPTSEQTLSGYFTELLTRARRGEVTDARAWMIEEMERELFSRAIAMANGNQAKAARWLGVSRTTMREKLAHFGLHASSEMDEEV